MGVNVDEPGGNDQAGHINDLGGLDGIEAVDRHDSIFEDREISDSSRRAGAVNDRPTFEDDLGHDQFGGKQRGGGRKVENRADKEQSHRGQALSREEILPDRLPRAFL